MNECELCGGAYDVPGDLEDTGLCNPCAQALVVELRPVVLEAINHEHGASLYLDRHLADAVRALSLEARNWIKKP